MTWTRFCDVNTYGFRLSAQHHLVLLQQWYIVLGLIGSWVQRIDASLQTINILKNICTFGKVRTMNSLAARTVWLLILIMSTVAEQLSVSVSCSKPGEVIETVSLTPLYDYSNSSLTRDLECAALDKLYEAVSKCQGRHTCTLSADDLTDAKHNCPGLADINFKLSCSGWHALLSTNPTPFFRCSHLTTSIFWRCERQAVYSMTASMLTSTGILNSIF